MDKEFKEERENHVGRMIHMLSHQLKRRGAVPEMETGLTPMQKHILTFILFETMERDLYQRDIEEEFRIRRSTASGILKLMEKNGFIYRKSVARDARLKQIVLTEKAEVPDGYSDEYQRDGTETDGGGFRSRIWKCVSRFFVTCSLICQEKDRSNEKLWEVEMNRKLFKSIREYKKNPFLHHYLSFWKSSWKC